MQFSAAVLAGGRSRRFGQDKARYVLGHKPLIGWVLDALGQAVQRYVIAGRDYSDFAPTFPDVVAGGDVMSGLHSALHHAENDWVAVVGCDQPFLTQAYWRFMLEQVSKDQPAVVAVLPGGFMEPLGALYHKSLEAEVLSRLQRGELKVQSLLSDVGAKKIPVANLQRHFGEHLFLNANTLEDLALSCAGIRFRDESRLL